MMKKAIIIVFMFSFSFLSAQTDSTKSIWNNFKTGGYASLLFNQITFLNWAKGGENSISATGLFHYTANLKYGRIQWDNIADLKYGLLISDEYGLRTNQDAIDISSKFGYQAMNKFFYSGLANFKSQFAPGYNYPNDSIIVSQFFSPAYLILSLGLDFKPNDNFSLYISPMTGKFIFVNSQDIADKGTYTSEPAIYDTSDVKIKDGRNLRSDFGAYLKINFKTEIYENITLNTKLEIFNNYTDKDIKNRRNFDVDWETSVVMKVNEFISANLLVHLIYDHNTKVPLFENINGQKTQVGVGPRLQLKEVIGIGISYKFN